MRIVTKVKRRNLTGKRFGKLTAIIPVQGKGNWLCVCKCGVKKEVKGTDLVAGKVRSCGCLFRELAAKRQFKHGFRKNKKNTHPIYRCWLNMKFRCSNPTATGFHNYGGKGIRVCNRWMSFELFFNDMSPTWKKGLTIERLENSKDYCPTNCVWDTRKVQANHTSRNRLITIFGKTKTLSQWSEYSGIPVYKIRNRLNRGWHTDHLLNPSNFNGKKPFNLIGLR